MACSSSKAVTTTREPHSSCDPVLNVVPAIIPIRGEGLTHILIIGGLGPTVTSATSLSPSLELTMFQKAELYSPVQAALMNRTYVFDYSDAEESMALARELHARHRLDAIVSFTEYGQEPAALIQHALGIVGNPLRPVELTRDKLKMRRLMAEHGFPSARYRECQSFEELRSFYEQLRRPLILKPVKGSGSEGVSSIDSFEGLQGAWQRASAAGLFPLMAQEYLEGPEFSVETQSRNGVHELVVVTEKLTTDKPSFVEVGHLLPAALPDAELKAIEETVLGFLDLVGHQLGPAHTEIRLTSEGPRIIESNIRAGGDFIPELVLLALGVDLILETLDFVAGGPIPQRRGDRGAAAIRYFARTNCTVRGVDGLDAARALPGVVRIDCDVQPGQALGPLLSSDSRQGYVIATGSNLPEARQNAERAFQQVTFRVT
jgi:biotin carboxylase